MPQEWVPRQTKGISIGMEGTINYLGEQKAKQKASRNWICCTAQPASITCLVKCNFVFESL
jgi:hypothetical protein